MDNDLTKMGAANCPRPDRRSIEAEIERLIGLLDKFDGDPDLEEAGDLEPSLGWPALGPQQFGRAPQSLDDDREEDNADCEPSLATPEAKSPPGMLRMSGDPESWLGGHLSGFHVRTNQLSQLGWAAGGDTDAEYDPTDHGEPDDGI
ncbi:hypothetical protein VE25_07490 [Devosia geojensis]|uniref:Uncharacterized protein n=1 Tax=Devosia geojensis TaxID=443610 RepID=A0A0F5FU34_9HYPH|nr:hypothetical protein [Devosia geojensis]KKB12386.1 hypothetical protein VE25_07490 [Devosia geojensis]